MAKFFGRNGYTIHSALPSSKFIEIMTWKNFNRMQVSAFEKPKTLKDIELILKRCSASNTKVKCIGAGHSFTSAAVVDDGGVLISLENFQDIIEITKETIKLQAGCTLAKMTHALKKQGLMLPACPEYGPFHVGAISGTQFQESTGNVNVQATISSYAISYKVMKADGTIETIQNDLEFWRNNQGLGGIVIDVTFKVKPLQKYIIEFDILSWNDFWSERQKLAAEYDELLSIYIPLLDKVYLEKRKSVKKFPATRFPTLYVKMSEFIRRHFIIKSMPWFYSFLQKLSLKNRKKILSFGLNYVFPNLFSKRMFLSGGGDRGYAFKSRPLEIYNDFMFNADVYPQVMNELRDFVQDERLVGSVLIATYPVAKDETCILSRTYYEDSFCIDPILYAEYNSTTHLLLQDKIFELGIRYKGRPHLNKVTNLKMENVRAGYNQENLKKFIDWCNMNDKEKIFQSSFYRILA